MIKQNSDERTYLKILDIQTCTTKKNYFYKKFLFEEIIFMGVKEISTGKKSERIFWKSRLMTVQDKSTNQIKTINSYEDLLYKSGSVGAYCAGKIVELSTTEYKLDGELKSSFLCVLFENEYEKVLSEAARQLNFYKALPLDTEGKRYKRTKNFDEVAESMGFDNELEYLKDEYEEELLDFMTGGDCNLEDFNGDWDELYSSKGLD